MVEAPHGQTDDMITMTADMVAAYVSHNSLASADLPALIHDLTQGNDF